MGDTTTTGTSPAAGKDSAWRKIVKDHLNKVLTFVLGWLLGLLTLGGQELTEWIDDNFFNPTDAVVIGEVYQQGLPLANAEVMLNRKGQPTDHRAITDSTGRYAIDDVNDGVYYLEVHVDSVKRFSLVIQVEDGATDAPVARIDTDAKVAIQDATLLTPTAAAAVPTSPPAGGGTPETSEPDSEALLPIFLPDEAFIGDQEVAPADTPDVDTLETPAATAPDVEIVYEQALDTIADSEVPLWTVRAGIETERPLEDIAYVTWHLPPSFQPSVVSRFREDDFILELQSPGSFELSALVVFTDGTEQYLTTTVELQPVAE
jgi:hypothetical protein